MRIDRLARDPDELYNITNTVILYFRQLEKHLADTQNENGLVRVGEIPLLPQNIKSLETLLPQLKERPLYVRKRASLLYLMLAETKDTLEHEFPDFKPKYNF